MPQDPQQLIAEMFTVASERWKGCDWSTQFGPLRLDLRGLRSGQAHLLAEATSGQESECWESAARWLRQVERDSQDAKSAAKAAMQHLERHDFTIAMRCIHLAVSLESKYHCPAVWQPLAKYMAELYHVSLTNQPPA